jgi:hypothetical protein
MQPAHSDGSPGKSPERHMIALILKIIAFAAAWLSPRLPQNAPTEIIIALPIFG